ncbi:tRNA wybutosine-synthesizing protein 5 [Patella vulgata]|uniref:tRNA wybutosine-synthesizing protein 5 n=1 Tax=Patella vulgata TaxID=6465 RepID=UPI00217F5735|nr:tRNA wybutosine-synthesizing protein 5 [Patella vulgata]
MDLLFSRIFLIFCLVCILTYLNFVYASEKIDLKKEPGHLQPFGTGRPIHQIEEVLGFPTPEDFLGKYCLPLKPVKFKDGAKLSPAFHLWTDEYFLNLNIPEKSKVLLETVKKESRQQKVVTMDFKMFVKNYMNTSFYMVDIVPMFLTPDLVLPCSLQCPVLWNNKIADILMWFSSGGTSSVVHYDAVDNINCVYRGSKDIVIVDPVKYEGMTLIDRPDGSYSDIDVDKMDYIKYPTLAKVEYIHAHLEPGDCLYIPHKWIHQVRSYNSSLAVNIWWNHYDALDIDTSQCNRECDETVTLDKVKLVGLDKLMTSNGFVKQNLAEGLISTPGNVMTYDKYIQSIFVMPDEADTIEFMNKDTVKKFLDLVDQDMDKMISVHDVTTLTSAKLAEVSAILQKMGDIHQEYGDEEGEGGDKHQDDLVDEGQMKDGLREDKSERNEL